MPTGARCWREALPLLCPAAEQTAVAGPGNSFVFIHHFLCSLYLKSRRGERPSWARGCALLGEEGAELLQVWAMAKGGPGRAGAGGCLLLGPPFGSATCSSTKI